MMWASLDRGVRAVREHGFSGDAERWEQVRERLRTEIDERGVHADGYFVQHYDSDEVDASLLVLPQVGYCAADDPRMLHTVEQMEQTLMHKGLLMRYRTSSGVDGLGGGEHPFLACSFWLVEQYAAGGRIEGARQVGNMPQALSHLTLVRASDALGGHAGRAAHRR